MFKSVIMRYSDAYDIGNVYPFVERIIITLGESHVLINEANSKLTYHCIMYCTLSKGNGHSRYIKSSNEYISIIEYLLESCIQHGEFLSGIDGVPDYKIKKISNIFNVFLNNFTGRIDYDFVNDTTSVKYKRLDEVYYQEYKVKKIIRDSDICSNLTKHLYLVDKLERII